MIGWWKAVDKYRPLALVQCSKTKAEVNLAPARTLYTGDLFEKSRDFVELMKYDWRILSAQHGMVHPGQFLSPYDKSLEEMRLAEREAWGHQVAQHLNTLLGGHRAPVIFLAGVTYRNAICGHPSERDQPSRRREFPFLTRLQIPMEGLGIGQQKAWLLAECGRLRQEDLGSVVREVSIV